MLVDTRELVVTDGMGTKPSLEANGTPPLVDEREVRSPVMLCSKHKPCSTSRLRYTDSLVVLIRVISLMEVLLSRSDIFDLADTLAAPGSIRVTPLSRGELVKTANPVASSTFELLGRCRNAVAANQFVKYSLVTQFYAFSQPKIGIVLAVVGEVVEGTELRTPLAPNPRRRQPLQYGPGWIFVLVRQRASIFVF